MFRDPFVFLVSMLCISAGLGVASCTCRVAYESWRDTLTLTLKQLCEMDNGRRAFMNQELLNCEGLK